MIVLLAIPQSGLFAQRVIRIVPPQGENDRRHEYTVKILTTALEMTKAEYGNFELRNADTKMNDQLAITNMLNNRGVDIYWAMTDTRLESILRPVRIPILKGLIGARLLLYNRRHTSAIGGLANDDDLKEITMLQGALWADTRILRANGFNVSTSPVYDELFEMLGGQQVRVFPRAVHEIWDELETHRNNFIAIDNQFLLYYPTAMYYFVRQGDENLAERIEKGLEMMIKDGTFEALFNEHMADKIRRSKIPERKIIRLQNPLLPEKTPIGIERYWYSFD